MSDNQRYGNEGFFSNNDYRRRIFPGEIAQSGVLTTQRTYTYAGYPDVNHDGVDSNGIGVQFYAGDKWHNTDADMWYRCVSNAQGAASWQAMCALPYGGIHVHDASAAQSVASGTTYIKITAFTDNGHYWNTTPDATNDKISLTIPGHYLVLGTFSWSSGTANITFFGTVFLKGVEQDQVHFTNKITTAGDIRSANLTGYIDASSATASMPMDLDFRMRHNGVGAVNVTISYANLTAQYVGVS